MKDRVGETYNTIKGGKLIITEYHGTNNITVIFDNGTILHNVTYSQISKGTLGNPMSPSVYDIGFMGMGKYNSKNSEKTHSVWHSMFTRCYDKDYLRRFPTYNECTVTVEWHNFQNFAEWFENNYVDGWQHDKDILKKGNKIYSPETCCFVPKEINYLILRRQSVRGKYPIGVTKKGNKYEARVSKNGSKESQGIFNTPEEAFQAYKIGKEKWIKKVAEKWKKFISKKVYKALYNYIVEITD